MRKKKQREYFPSLYTCVSWAFRWCLWKSQKEDKYMSASDVSVFCWFESFFVPNLFFLRQRWLGRTSSAEYYLKKWEKHYCVCGWIFAPSRWIHCRLLLLKLICYVKFSLFNYTLRWFSFLSILQNFIKARDGFSPFWFFLSIKIWNFH